MQQPIQNFPDGSANLLFGQISPKNCIKMKKIEPGDVQNLLQVGNT